MKTPSIIKLAWLKIRDICKVLRSVASGKSIFKTRLVQCPQLKSRAGFSSFGWF